MTTTMEEEERRMVQARDVYVVMKKDYRISRNIRASWFFQHLNKTLDFTPKDHLEDTNYELQVASVVGDDGTQCLPGNKYNVALLPSTMVTFVAHRYRFVIILDVSPSVSSVDTSSCTVLYEKVHKALSNFLRGLVLPFQLPGSQIVFTPEVHITVVAYTPVNCFTSSQVLVQGLVISADNIDKVLSSMAVKLKNFESTLAINFKKCLACSNISNSYYDVRNSGVDQSTGPQISKGHDIINSPESGIVNMIRCGMLALQLLPENSSAGLVVVTDGCLGVPDANLFEFLLTQLRTGTISCSFLRIGENRSPFGHYGHIPHTELLQFISTATFGSYFDSCPDVCGNAPYTLNVYHKAMFMWNFQRGLEGFRFDLGDQNLMLQQSSSPSDLVQRLLSHPIHGKLASVMPNLRKRHSEADLNTSLFSVLSVRLREGYTIRDIAITKGETQIEIRLVLPWREYARFEYLLRAVWPLQTNRPVTHVEITSEGIYDFLHDMTCSQMMTNKMSGFRSANVMKFWLVLQGLSQTDQLLVHLQSFSNNPVHYTLPGSVKEGVPLFYVPLPTSTVPTLSTQLNSKDPVLSQFASFWRPVVHLDYKVWQKWMHTHRIGLVLEHDIPVNKHIHIPSSSYRYTSVLCRQSLTTLNLFLTEWSTFVLLDNQSYIKLLFESTEDKSKPPSSFVLIRITSKAPCLVLRLAFLGGTPAYQRYEVVKELKKKVAMLRFPQRGPKTDKLRRSTKVQLEEKETIHKPPLMREWSEIKCCVLLYKPVESILIRHEKMPRDMTKLEEWVMPEVSQFLPYKTQSKSKSMVNLFNSLSKYLLHRRWIWTVQESGVNSISMQGVGRILSTLTKMRLQQGFHFGLTNQGIVNMVLEVDMKDPECSVDYTMKSKHRPTCVVQYILFPPYTKTTSDNLSDDDDEMESTEDDGILQIITECWIEPQHGISYNNTPERLHFDGKSCQQLASVFYPQDLECISSLLTLEHLNYLCQNKLIPSNLSSIVNVSCKPGYNTTKLDPTIEHIQFPFDLLSLLPKCQQAELIYPTFLYEENGENKTSGKEANLLLYSLFLEELNNCYDRNVDLSEETSCLFMKHVYSRSRSIENHPFPFKIEDFASSSNEKRADKNSQSKQTPVYSSTTASQSNLSSSLKSVPLQTKNVSSSEQPQNDKTESERIPTWKCLIKHTNSNNLVLTFLPASFEDIVILADTDPSTVLSDTTEDTISGSSANVSSVAKDSAEAGRSTESGKTTAPNSIDSESKSESVSETGPVLSVVSDSQTVKDGAETKTVSGSEATDSKDELNTDKKQNVKKLLKVPVYMYDCVTQNVLNSLVNPWDFQLPADVFEDIPFESNSEPSDTNTPASPKHPKRVSFSLDNIKDEDETSWRSSWRSQERRSTEGSSDGGDNILTQCSILSELFYNCYIRGVFQSLQKGYNIDGLDVDAAINNICEESLPLECNMTSFLHASCCHFQHFVNEARKEGAKHKEETLVTEHDSKPHSVRFIDTLDETDRDHHNADGIKIPGVLEIPKVTLNFDLSLLQLEVPCERVKNLHDLIKSKFLDTVNKWFRQIPSSPDYYVYCPETAVSEGSTDDRETTASDVQQGGSSNIGTMPESDGGNLPNLNVPTASRDDRISNASVLDSEESMEDDAMLDLDYLQDDKSDQSPLFINFTCTVKSRLQQYSLSVRNLAVCIGELQSVLEKFSTVGLNELKITFDLNCLTLPADVDYTSPRRPSMLRMFSNSSITLGSTSSGSDLEDNTDRGSESVLGTRHLLDPISHLPPRQHDAVTKCMEEIEWLLQDEIVSNLRDLSPIDTDSLNYVAKHIHHTCNIGKANVSVDNLPLQFVFGSESSIEKFIEEFQKMTLQNYQLIKEESWYYLAKKRILGFSFINASMLNNALSELSQWNSKPGSVTKVQSPSSVSDHVDFKCAKALSPLVTKDKITLEIAEENNDTKDVQVDTSAVATTEIEPSADVGTISVNVTSANAESQVTSAVTSPVMSTVTSPVMSDVSIQLTKTDGHIEPYRSSPERKEGLQKSAVNDSFESDELENEAVLKRSSSFAGFRSNDSTAVLKPETMNDGQSPVKGPQHILIGSQLRSRHCSAPVSGQGTPRSKVSTLPYTPSCISSRDSFTEDGVSYDGDMSEMDDSATTFSDSGVVTRMMPHFWLIMYINVNHVDLLFQHRETGKETNEETLELRNLITTMKDNVAKTCRRVNQQMLLNNLNETRMCHNLLVDAAEDEVSWNIDSGNRLKPRHQNISSSENDDEEEDDETFERKYLAAAMDLSPGYFDCDCIWRTRLFIHPGLKRGSGRGSTMSIGIKALRLVLNPLSVNNRNNMFVMQETATKNVYYLRLKEISANSLRSSVTVDDNLDTSSNLLKPIDNDKDTDATSLCSSSSILSLSQKYLQDCVELSVHGIDEAGKEIKEDLVHLLQKKLDEATLEKICEMLRRNPQCQLDCHDVMFIQKPSSDPVCKLHVTVSSRASPQLAAVMYYLRQNLLQFLHTPKYKSSECQFMDKFDGLHTVIPTDQAFLYIPPLTARKTGIAVVSVCLVDGLGNQVKLLQCPKPSCLAYTELESLQDMESFVSTQIYELQPQSKRPGPTALIQFHLWQAGDVDLVYLQDRLNHAVKYALCDVLMEYHILTAPISEDFRERKLSMVTTRKPDTHLDRRSSLQNQSRLQSLRDALIQSTKRAMSPTPDSSKMFDITGVDISTGSSVPIRTTTTTYGSPMKGESSNLLTLYETGERGTLHKLYSDLLEDWIIHCCQLDCPSMHRVNFSLKSRFSIDYVLQEFHHIVKRSHQSMCTKIYKMLPKDEVDEDTNIGLLYAPNRSPFESGRRQSETSLDTCRHQVVTPGVDLNFTAICRDLEQWYSFIHGVEDTGDTVSSTSKGKYPSQKFPAHIPSETETKPFGMFLESSSLIPRQKFLMLTIKNKQIWLYGYNWTNESFQTMSKELTKLINWNNARTHLLGNVITQKCGSYNHYLPGNPLCTLDKMNQIVDNIEQLINHTAPPHLHKEKLSRTHSMSSVRDTYLPFDMAFKDSHPNKPLHLCYLTCHNDVVKQYGQQAQDIRMDCKKNFERVNNISKLYVMWVQKMTPNYPISETIMKQLKQASRLFHYCATPLLFSAKWRKNVLEKFKVNRQDSVTSNVSVNTPDLKSRSRHGSGTSVGSARTKRTDSNELKKRPSLHTFKEFQVETVDESSLEDEWHSEIRSTFIHQYIKYLHTVGFHYVQMDKDKGKVKRRLTKSDEDSFIPQSEDMEYKPTDTHNLQKTVSGGVLLIEISFRDEYFCVKLFTCDHSKLGITVNQQKSEIEDIPMTQELKLLFVDECEKCKQVIHVHSFAHDFHLRSIQSYISGENKVFKQGYYLAGLLNDFVKVYAYAPSFSRNFLQREVISIPEPSCSSEDLYDYMQKHSKLHAMSVLKMLVPSEGDLTSEHGIKTNVEYALVSHESREVRTFETKSYNIGVVILQDSGNRGDTTAGEKQCLKLQFYMILTSSEIVYPRQTLDRDSAGLLKRTSSGDKKIFGDLKDQITVKKSVSVRELSTNYLGFSNKHQPPMYQLLQKEAVEIKHKIENMAVVSMDKCRRDNLWMKMLMFKCDEPTSKKRSDTDDNKDRKQTFEEFREMLARVHKVPLYEMDPRLLPFVHMSDGWYQGLTQVINKKYTDDVKRCYINPENNDEKHYIIVNPKFLDLFMMLSTDPAGGSTGLYAVFRKPAKEQESICPGGQNVPERNVQSHMEKFINTCCFYMWSSML
ncbi:KICSTOR complex protein szt2 [Mactra antiquata]